MSNIFTLIKEPEETPTNLLDSYRQQNIIMQKMRMLGTAFDGIKLNHWSDDDRELPDILAGSICEFEGRLFETNENIKLIDNITDVKEDLRFIKLVIVRDADNKDNDYLRAEIAGGYSEMLGNRFPDYDYDNRGFYVKDENNIIKEKYLRLSMKYDANLGGYVDKKYWNINDFQRKGLTLKRKTVTFEAGEHEFDFPDDVNTITVHLVSAGGGGAGLVLQGWGQAIEKQYGAAGGDSKVVIADKDIVICKGGGGGTVDTTDGSAAASEMRQTGGAGGAVTFDNVMQNLVEYRNGSVGLTEKKYYTQTGHNGGVLIHNTLCFGGYGGQGNFIVPDDPNHSYSNKGGAGGGAGSCAVITLNRSVLNGAKKVKIIVGSGGVSGDRTKDVEETKGQDGSALIEYMQK